MDQNELKLLEQKFLAIAEEKETSLNAKIKKLNKTIATEEMQRKRTFDADKISQLDFLISENNKSLRIYKQEIELIKTSKKNFQSIVDDINELKILQDNNLIIQKSKEIFDKISYFDQNYAKYYKADENLWIMCLVAVPLQFLAIIAVLVLISMFLPLLVPSVPLVSFIGLTAVLIAWLTSAAIGTFLGCALSNLIISDPFKNVMKELRNQTYPKNYLISTNQIEKSNTIEPKDNDFNSTNSEIVLSQINKSTISTVTNAIIKSATNATNFVGSFFYAKPKEISANFEKTTELYDFPSHHL